MMGNLNEYHNKRFQYSIDDNNLNISFHEYSHEHDMYFYIQIYQEDYQYLM